MPTREQMEAVMQKRLGDAECFSYDSDTAVAPCNGGTDAEPALRKALTMLAGSDTATGYKNADILMMISDFVMADLSADLVTAIEQEKVKNTGFYSLVIGASGNKNTITCFNHNWLYDTNDTRASRHLVEQLHELKT